MKVRARELGYYDHKRQREGSIFTMDVEEGQLPSWVERVDESTPEKVVKPVKKFSRETEVS
jgi:hypothetical protein